MTTLSEIQTEELEIVRSILGDDAFSVQENRVTVRRVMFALSSESRVSLFLLLLNTAHSLRFRWRQETLADYALLFRAGTRGLGCSRPVSVSPLRRSGK
jgi:hypothetical protein